MDGCQHLGSRVKMIVVMETVHESIIVGCESCVFQFRIRAEKELLRISTGRGIFKMCTFTYNFSYTMYSLHLFCGSNVIQTVGEYGLMRLQKVEEMSTFI
jgi:hypothetical protein